MKDGIQDFELIIDEFTQSGIAVINDFLSANGYLNLKNEILSHNNTQEFKKAAIGKNELETIDSSVRGDHIIWLNEEDSRPGVKAYFKRITNLYQYLNYSCFAGIQNYEFHFTKYPPNTFYKKHLDVFVQDDARMFSVIFYLNDHWCKEDGGELVVYAKDKNLNIEPIANRLVFFDSKKFEHEVLKTTKNRYSLTGWFKKNTII